MEMILENFELIFFVLAVVFFACVLILSVQLSKAVKKYKNLLAGMSEANLEEIILHNADKIKELEGQVLNNREKIVDLYRISEKTLKHMALKRFDAFDNTGGKQSFSIALLDDKGDGFSLTTINGREHSYTYSKQIIDGKSEYDLSKEEKEVIEKALNH